MHGRTPLVVPIRHHPRNCQTSAAAMTTYELLIWVLLARNLLEYRRLAVAAFRNKIKRHPSNGSNNISHLLPW